MLSRRWILSVSSETMLLLLFLVVIRPGLSVPQEEGGGVVEQREGLPHTSTSGGGLRRRRTAEKNKKRKRGRGRRPLSEYTVASRQKEEEELERAAPAAPAAPLMTQVARDTDEQFQNQVSSVVGRGGRPGGQQQKKKNERLDDDDKGLVEKRDATAATTISRIDAVVERAVRDNNPGGPPPGYPWHLPNNSKNKFVGPLLSHVSSQFSIPDKDGGLNIYLPAYIIGGDGRLLTRRSHHIEQRTRPDMGYVGRIETTEELIHGALRLGEKLRGTDPRIAQLFVHDGGGGGSGRGGIPLVLSWQDYRTCSRPKDSFPFFPYWMHTRPQKCTAFAVPGYDQWKKHRNVISSSSEGREGWPNVIQAREEKYPWEDKIRLAVWRGATTGMPGPFGVESWRNVPRFRLVRQAVYHEDVIDAGFHQMDKGPKTMLKDQIPFEDFAKYRAVIDIDGHSWSSRFAELLCLNSVVVKVEPTFRNYFNKEPALVPWKHYVPVRGDLSDLVETVEYVLDDDNEEQMRGIVREANAWCSREQTAVGMITNMLWILVSYVEFLNQGDRDWREKWEAEFSGLNDDVDLVEVGNTKWWYQRVGA